MAINSANGLSATASAPIKEHSSRDGRRLVLPFALVGAGLLFMTGATRSFADDNCQQLEALSQRYEGVELTPVQRQIKRRMVVWYSKNCRTHRSAEAN